MNGSSATSQEDLNCRTRITTLTPRFDVRAAHDQRSAVTIRGGQDDLGAPDKLARRVAVGGQRFKFSAIGGAMPC